MSADGQASVRTLFLDGNVRPHVARTVWGVRVWAGHPENDRVDEYASRAKAEELLRTDYGTKAELVCREIGPWTRTTCGFTFPTPGGLTAECDLPAPCPVHVNGGLDANPPSPVDGNAPSRTSTDIGDAEL